MKTRFWVGVFLAGFVATSAGAVEFFVPIPYLGGKPVYRTELVRQDWSKVNVNFIYAAEGRSALGVTASRYKVLPGPSTDMFHPLLTDNVGRDQGRNGHGDPKYFLAGGGLVIMEGEPGLVGAETAVVFGGEPSGAWELPMLTSNDAFRAGQTVHVLNLLKGTGTVSHLSIFNLDRISTTVCRTRLTTAAGVLVEERTGIVVPAVGSKRIADILSRVTAATATGLSVAVSCDRPFYTLGGFPAAKIEDIRVHYPSIEPPNRGTREILLNNQTFRVVNGSSEKKFPLPLVPGARYRSLVIDFDVAVTAPTNTAFFRSILGLWRPEPDRRFGKTLYFGTVDRFDRAKLMTDLGTPYIELLVKRSKAALQAGRTYHFHIEIDADQKTVRQLVTNAGGAVVSDLLSGLFNDELVTRNGQTLILGFGLPGIADGAYSPPFGWRFSKIIVSGYR